MAGEKINQIVRKMRAARQYATKPYIRGVSILDFDEAARKKYKWRKENKQRPIRYRAR